MADYASLIRPAGYYLPRSVAFTSFTSVNTTPGARSRV
jgi:hypothetical protein